MAEALNSHEPVPAVLNAHARYPGNDTQLESRVETFDSQLRVLPGIVLPIRSMLITAAAQQILISPVVTPAETAALAAAGVAIAAPSLLHHLTLAEAIRRYRPREVWGPAGFDRKRPELGSVRIFGRDHWPYQEHVEYVVLDGAPLRNEVVFFDKHSRTIYTADLVFNMHETSGLLTPLMLRAMGVYDRVAMTRLWRVWIKDRSAFDAALRRVLAWDFDRLVMAHGDIVQTGGRAALIDAAREVGILV